MRSISINELVSGLTYTKAPVCGNIEVKITATEVSKMNETFERFPDLRHDSVVAKVWKRNFALQQKIDDEVKTKKIKLLCEKDCCACCFGYFYISPAEYFALKHYLLSTQPDVFAKAQIIAKEQWRQLKEIFPKEYNKLSNPTKTNFDDDHEHLEKFYQCPFQQEGLCSVYEVRPLICQLYGTSHYIEPCMKQIKQIRNFFSGNISDKKKERHYIGIDPKSPDLHTDIDYHIKNNPLNALEYEPVIHRSYPIVYWLSKDTDYEERYQLSVHTSAKTYWEGDCN